MLSVGGVLHTEASKCRAIFSFWLIRGTNKLQTENYLFWGVVDGKSVACLWSDATTWFGSETRNRTTGNHYTEQVVLIL